MVSRCCKQGCGGKETVLAPWAHVREACVKHLVKLHRPEKYPNMGERQAGEHSKAE